MFRPRFRLSLLFVLAALVAGVSVWLRQAVVRDRNIREFYSEDYAQGCSIHGETRSLNTKFLNYFREQPSYADRFYVLQVDLTKLHGSKSFLKYQDADLGVSVENLRLHGWIKSNPDQTNGLIEQQQGGKVSLSHILFILRIFPANQEIRIEGGSISDDLEKFSTHKNSCPKLTIYGNILDTKTILKIIKALEFSTDKLGLFGNQIFSSIDELQDLGRFSKPQLELIRLNNMFIDRPH